MANKSMNMDGAARVAPFLSGSVAKGDRAFKGRWLLRHRQLSQTFGKWRLL
jgi:hypothetical protein